MLNALLYETLDNFLKICNDVYTQKAIETLSDFFSGTKPTLQEVCDAIVDYCNVSNFPFNDNVYLITAPNGKQYIGQTVNFDDRMSHYRKNRGSNPHWRSALKLYKFDNFDIDHCSIPTSCSDIVEKFMIMWYDLINPEKGYNKTSGGKNGWVMTSEVREKISMALKEVPKSNETKAAMKASWTREYRSSRSGKNHPFFGKQRLKHGNMMTGINNPMFGKNRPDLSERNRKNSGQNHPFFGKKRLEISGEHNSKWGKKFPEHSARMSGGENPAAKPVVVNGILYTNSKEASEKINKNEGYVSHYISKNKESTIMFKVSKDFYMDCYRKQVFENISREMYEQYYYFL